MIARARPGSNRMAAFFGDIRGNVYSVDAMSGELLWKVAVDPHPLARIIAAVKVHEGRVYVPVAGLDNSALADTLLQAVTAISGLVAIFGRLGARDRIG